MTKKVFNYMMISFLLMVYINRGLFVASVEMDTNANEINSVAELLTEIITRQSNNTDEDGDSQETCNSVKIVQPHVSQHFSQLLELWNKFPQETENVYRPANENILQQPVYGQIDHPPQA